MTDAAPFIRTSIPLLAVKTYALVGAIIVLAVAALAAALAQSGGRVLTDLTAPAAIVALAPASTVAGRLFARLARRVPSLREAGTFGLVSVISAMALAFAGAAAMRWIGAKAWLMTAWTDAVSGQAAPSAFAFAVALNVVALLMTAWSFWSSAGSQIRKIC